MKVHTVKLKDVDEVLKAARAGRRKLPDAVHEIEHASVDAE
jgi:hypothetical protein